LEIIVDDEELQAHKYVLAYAMRQTYRQDWNSIFLCKIISDRLLRFSQGQASPENG
jgi:hypothetical protein